MTTTDKEKQPRIAKGTQVLEIQVLKLLEDAPGKSLLPSQLQSATGKTRDQVYAALVELRSQDHVEKIGNNWAISAPLERYIDWNHNLAKMMKLYELKIPTITIGPKGCGKTECIIQACSKLDRELFTVNLSLRTRESHILGRLDITEKNGTQVTTWKKGPLPLSMESGGIFYADELSAGEPDVLLRLDECLDGRRQLSYESETIKAHEDWWPTASINPQSTLGTKELPPQLLSRFTARLAFTYPDPITELKIVRAHTKFNGHKDELISVIGFFNNIRQTKELPYTPSIRETIAFARMLQADFEFRDCMELIAFNPMLHWDQESYNTIKELAVSQGLS